MTDIVQTSKPLILLAEDDSLLLKMYQTKFLAEGFEVLVASDGETALKFALENKVNCIVLDVMMPKLSGIDILERLQKEEKTKSIPVIILSNLSQSQEVNRAMRLGAKEFLVKASLTPSQVVEKIKLYIKT